MLPVNWLLLELLSDLRLVLAVGLGLRRLTKPSVLSRKQTYDSLHNSDFAPNRIPSLLSVFGTSCAPNEFNWILPDVATSCNFGKIES